MFATVCNAFELLCIEPVSQALFWVFVLTSRALSVYGKRAARTQLGPRLASRYMHSSNCLSRRLCMCVRYRPLCGYARNSCIDLVITDKAYRGPAMCICHWACIFSCLCDSPHCLIRWRHRSWLVSSPVGLTLHCRHVSLPVPELITGV